MILDFNGKVAWVTGAGSQIGFGKAIALTFAKFGCDIVINDVNPEGLKQTAAEIEALGRKAFPVTASVANSAGMNDLVKAAMEKFGKIDILVNNAGIPDKFKPFIESTEADWDPILNVNLKGVIICTRAVLPQMLARKSGKIINIGSGGNAPTGATHGHGPIIYGVTKNAVNAFTQLIAADVAAEGINVNCVIPGMADTGLAANAPPGFLKRMISTIPSGRLTETQDVANAVAFLASDEAGDIVGQCLRVTGGM